MLLESVKLTNILSFGSDGQEIALRPLNVLIGPNGSGKSNLLECIGLLQAAPTDLAKPIREGGGIFEWLYKGAAPPTTASLEAVILQDQGSMSLRHRLDLDAASQRFELIEERIETKSPFPGHEHPYLYFGYDQNRPVLNVKEEKRRLRREDIDPRQSILSQRKDPDQYPELTYLGQAYAKIKIYREWAFGRFNAPRLPQKTDLPNDFLSEDASNLALALSIMRRQPQVKQEILRNLTELYREFKDFDAIVEGGTVQIFFDEGRFSIPATRLSDGTLRYLCLLAILLHPKPPPLICIEEPEMCLHPDMLPALAALLRNASSRTQLVVTTHSDILIDALSDSPEDILVAEKEDGETRMKRYGREELGDWLKKYALGELWRKGELGGNRW